MTSLLDKYSPILYFNTNEKYYPCGIDWLLENSILIDHNTTPVTKIESPTNIDLYNIINKYPSGFTDGTINISFDKELYKGQTPLNKVPCYGIIRQKEGKTYLTYIFLYAYNGEYNILNITNAGYHPGDAEHMTIELNEKDEINRIFYGAHGKIDGRWISKSDVEFENDKPVAYVALNGHGLYPKVGTVFRMLGVSNDYLEKGIRWKPKVFEIYPINNPLYKKEEMYWAYFKGRLGGTLVKGDKSGISSLTSTPWFGQNGTDIDILDELSYKPPQILSVQMVNSLSQVKNIGKIIFIYLLCLILYKISNSHVMTIFILTMLLILFDVLVKFFVDKYA